MSKILINDGIHPSGLTLLKKAGFEVITERIPQDELAERLILQDGIQYMLGPYSSGLTKAIAPITEKYHIPMVEANGASRSLFTKGYQYLFAVLSAANQYLEVAVDLAAEKAKEQNHKESTSPKIRNGIFF